MAGSTAIIVLDGSYGEGGGALLRTALVMSAMTQQPMRIDKVRGNTRFPGLDVEDMMILDALSKSCKAETVGAELGSSTVSFLPTSRPRGLNTGIEAVRTSSGRGPNALVVLNALLPVMTRSGIFSSITMEGETYGFNSLSYDYFANVTLQALRSIGLYAYPDLLRPGFGRESGGEVKLEIEPSALTGIEWTNRGSLRSVHAIVSTSNLSPTVAGRAVSHLKNMATSAGIPMEVEQQDLPGKQPGAFITTWAKYENGMGGGIAMGQKGVKPETIAHASFDQMTSWMSSSATVDEYLADQLLVPLVFAEGPSTFSVPKLTQRLLTSIWVIKQFTPIHMTVRGLENGPGSVSIQR